MEKNRLKFDACIATRSLNVLTRKTAFLPTRIKAKIQEKINENSLLKSCKVAVYAKRNEIIILGKVDSYYKKQNFIKLILEFSSKYPIIIHDRIVVDKPTP